MSDQKFEEHQNINKHAAESMIQAVKGAMIVNGGAAIGVLGFASSVDNGVLAGLASGLTFFVWGLLAAVSTFSLAYITNYLLSWKVYRDGKALKIAHVTAHIIAFLSFLTSMVFFGCGSYAVRDALLAIP